MLTRTARHGVILLTVGAALALCAARPRLEDLVLVKIEREQPATVAAASLDEAVGVEEIASGWIAVVPGALLRRLQSSGAAVTVLDETPSGKHYFLVFGGGEADLRALKAAGRVMPLEAGVALVSSSDDILRPRVAAHLGVAALSLSSPSLVRPVFDRPGRGRAVPRAQGASQLAATDPRIVQAAASVSTDRLAAVITTLESYQTRYATTTGATAAANYLVDQFRLLGLQAEYDDFTFTTANYQATNVVATLPGRSSPRDIVVISSHYDSYSDQRPAVAPGADDNASGTSAVLEAARVLAGVGFDFTVKFIAFSAEEFGLYGSAHYAQDARNRGDRILAVINLDMIGYADQLPEDLDVIANPDSEWLVDRVRSVAASYTALPIAKSVSASTRSSDHAPFWDRGYAAVLCIEDIPLKNPYYHRVTDRFETLTMSFATAAVRTAVAAVGDLAQPVGPVATPGGLSAQAEVFRSLFSRARRGVLQWTATPGAAGYNVYRATSSHGDYRRINASRVTGATFADDFVPVNSPAFYVVTTVDAQGRESNYSAEAVAR
jgi:hypothetical protein